MKRQNGLNFETPKGVLYENISIPRIHTCFLMSHVMSPTALFYLFTPSEGLLFYLDFFSLNPSKGRIKQEREGWERLP
jgi:hypothetical protein